MAQSTKTTIITFDQLMTRINILNQTDPKGQSPHSHEGWCEIYQTPNQNGYIYTVQVYFNDLLGSWAHGPYQDSIVHHVISVS